MEYCINLHLNARIISKLLSHEIISNSIFISENFLFDYYNGLNTLYTSKTNINTKIPKNALPFLASVLNDILCITNNSLVHFYKSRDKKNPKNRKKQAIMGYLILKLLKKHFGISTSFFCKEQEFLFPKNKYLLWKYFLAHKDQETLNFKFHNKQKKLKLLD